MKQRTEFEEISEARSVPVLRLMPLKRENPYGSVPGLDDEELADPRELERQVMLQEWGPILALPVRSRRGWIQPNVDENWGIDFGAFGTVDFSRTVPEFDRVRYKADKLQEKLLDELAKLAMVSERLPMQKRQVLKYLVKGVIELEHIQNEDMLALARLCLKVERLQKEIAELREASWKRRQKRLAEVSQ